ncbi:glycosyltransferase [Nubsella zeaxanthinifaciens]|uniref:glycosyltransferase n=1 Tax=Nubsella zeaxanthinifaciens TaxID=392412 RepID=UPI000DE38CBB|nr:glycosyltransferase [Nubsella zeaxanthinifaciens]
MVKFSVLMSVYVRESVANFVAAMDSLLQQTVKPHEIVLVKDGPLYLDLDVKIGEYQERFSGLIKVISLKDNLGLGAALAIGLENCTCPIVARMDTDDVCRKNRFERQLEFINIGNYDVVGSNIEEFNSFPGDLGRFKINRENHEDNIKIIKLKSPFNHPSIMFKKSIVMRAGGYNGDLPLFEDYSLFLRLWKSGAIFYNIQEVLLDFRVGSGITTIKRRSGLHYLKKEWNFVKYAKNIGAFGSFDVIKYVVLKFPIRILPPKVVLFIYNAFLRTSR